MIDYLNDVFFSIFRSPGDVDKVRRIEESDLADDTPVTGAILKEYFNRVPDSLAPLALYRPNRVGFALLLEIGFIKGQLGDQRPEPGNVPAGFVFLDTTNEDEITWSDGATWRGVAANERLIDLVLISLRNSVAAKVDSKAIDALVDSATPAANTLRKLELITEALNTALLAKLDTGAFLTELATKPIAASQVTGILDPQRIPSSVRASPIVSSGDFAALTIDQLDRIGEGSAVVLSSGVDAGKTFYYSGAGSKTDVANYIEGADATPDVSQVAGLTTALAAKADAAPALYRPLPNYGTDGSGAAADSNPVTGVGGYVHGDNVHPYTPVVLS